MALSISSIYIYPTSKTLPKLSPSKITYTPFYLPHQNLSIPSKITSLAKQQTGSSSSSVKSNNSNKKRKKKSNPIVNKELGIESLNHFEEGDDEENEIDIGRGNGGNGRREGGYVPLPLPKPPAGFVVDDQGRVLMVAPKRLVTIVDPTNNLPLECMIRRVFTNSKEEDCLLLCPVDTPVQILKSTNIEGWSAVSDDEVESILPTAAYALAKIHMHLVLSGFCYTARGGFCYSEDSIFEFRSDDGQNVDGVPTEGVEITCFHLDGSHYMIYTPSDPLLFVAAKDENGQLRIADDDLLDDPAVVSAIDEETEFNALVEEEAALLESMFGET